MREMSFEIGPQDGVKAIKAANAPQQKALGEKNPAIFSSKCFFSKFF